MALVALTPEEIQDALEVHHELNNPHVTRLLDIQREEVVQRVVLATYWENGRWCHLRWTQHLASCLL